VTLGEGFEFMIFCTFCVGAKEVGVAIFTTGATGAGGGATGAGGGATGAGGGATGTGGGATGTGGGDNRSWVGLNCVGSSSACSICGIAIASAGGGISVGFVGSPAVPNGLIRVSVASLSGPNISAF